MPYLWPNILRDFVGLIFPPSCIGCEKPLVKGEKWLCLDCQSALSYHPALLHSTPFPTNRFLETPNLAHAAAYLSFQKGGLTQKILHHIKYKDRPQLATWCGLRFTHYLDFLGDADVLVPVPLHPKKLKKWGYNQSMALAEGIGQGLDLPVMDALERVKHTQTQTRKSRWNRFENVEAIFQCREEVHISGAHAVVVDDVITTGATIQSAGKALTEAGAEKISYLSLALAE